MEVVVTLAVSIAVILVLARRAEQRGAVKQLIAGEGQLRHLRSGDYPAACTWCKTTTLARKLLVFARTPEGWEAVDVLARLARCPDAEVPTLARALHAEQPGWRRFCGEPCVFQFFAAVRAPLRDTFVACSYCSMRSPATLVRCPHCGGARCP